MGFAFRRRKKGARASIRRAFGLEDEVEASADDFEAALVVEAEETVLAVAGLELGLRAATVADGEDAAGATGLVAVRHAHAAQPTGHHQVVGFHAADVATARLGEHTVERADVVVGQLEQADARIGERADDSATLVGGAVVGYDELEIRKVLTEYAFQALAQPAGGVVHRHNNRQGGLEV